MEQIEGIVEDIIYCNNQNWYTVCEIRSGRRLITIVGYMPGLAVAENIIVRGTWIHHQDYGKQLKVESFERSLPTTLDSLLKYLSSGAIKGIGAITAKKIIEKFGDDTLRVLQFEPMLLSEIKGISTDKVYVLTTMTRANTSNHYKAKNTGYPLHMQLKYEEIRKRFHRRNKTQPI